jgi:chromosome segregation ATPase
MGVSKLTKAFFNINKKTETEKTDLVPPSNGRTEIEKTDSQRPENKGEVKMQKDSTIEQLDKEIQRLKEEHTRINEQLSDLETKAKSKLTELTALEEKRQREAEKARLNGELKDVFTQLLALNWQSIPKFLNESFAHIRGIASEYDELRSRENALAGELTRLKKELAYSDVEIAKMQGEIHRSIGDRVELVMELRRLLQLIDEKEAEIWFQDSKNVLRIFDIRRETLKLNWQ